jgi:hypothetical protein
MSTLCSSFLRNKTSCIFGFGLLLLIAATQALAQEAPDTGSGPLPGSASPKAAPVERQEPAKAETHETLAPEGTFDKAMFQRLIPADQLTFLTQYAGAPSNEVYRDKQFRRLLHGVVPGWMFHYGRDMPIQDALDKVMEGSAIPVEVRDGRYVTVSGDMGPYLRGRGFLWVDMKDGIMLGGFYFRPTNGEPTPTLTIFSKQVREDALAMSELPPEFGEDLRRWSFAEGVQPLTTRYFIGDLNARILLEHDEDFCSYLGGAHGPPDDDCEQTNADAADLDMNTAYYLEQVHHATNATAWMIVGDEETAWITVRNRRCGGMVDPLGCRIRLTREHTRGIVLPTRKR